MMSHGLQLEFHKIMPLGTALLSNTLKYRALAVKRIASGIIVLVWLSNKKAANLVS